ncbi:MULTISPECIES: hypothetical protein [Nocardia]|uniref:hypothetical protein n=1 Tax=Nocardia TaxID=1817 RepID=UPI002455989B|nr:MULTISPECIES: hypothetical protein [Nocardia]
MAEISSKRPGRPSLGARKQLKVRVYEDVREASKVKAKERGMTETDYIAWLIERDDPKASPEREPLFAVRNDARPERQDDISESAA